MLFEGNPEVLARLFLKKRLLAEESPRHAEIRPALLILSGVMRGAYGGGQVSALERFGLSDTFDAAVGISTGAPTAGYFLAKQAALGTTIYSEECTTPSFLSLSRFLRGRGPIMDTDYLVGVFRGKASCKRLDQATICKSRTRFYVGVTCAETGQGEFLDAKAAMPDVAEAIHASLVTPGISRSVVSLGGKTWTDGSVAFTFPLRKLIADFEPTDVLILANHTGVRRQGFSFEQLLLPLLFTKLPAAVHQVFAQRNRQFADELQFLRTQCQVRSAVIWTGKEVGRFERKPQKLKFASRTAEIHLLELLATAQSAVPALTM